MAKQLDNAEGEVIRAIEKTTKENTKQSEYLQKLLGLLTARNGTTQEGLNIDEWGMLMRMYHTNAELKNNTELTALISIIESQNDTIALSKSVTKKLIEDAKDMLVTYHAVELTISARELNFVH